MKFTLTFDMDNAAFDDNMATEAKRIISQAASRIGQGEDTGLVRDNNGNVVGGFTIDKE